MRKLPITIYVLPVAALPMPFVRAAPGLCAKRANPCAAPYLSATCRRRRVTGGSVFASLTLPPPDPAPHGGGQVAERMGPERKIEAEGRQIMDERGNTTCRERER